MLYRCNVNGGTPVWASNLDDDASCIATMKYGDVCVVIQRAKPWGKAEVSRDAYHQVLFDGLVGWVYQTNLEKMRKTRNKGDVKCL